MASKPFQFKQFLVKQERSLLKVCTESCLFGSLMPQIGSGRFLDIGTGNGLLALMAAQINPLSAITAIEPDEGSFQDAFENIQNSHFNQRITVLNLRLQDFEPEYNFDCIWCNPPFFPFEVPKHTQKNEATHGLGLPPEYLFEFCEKYLNEKGYFGLLTPPDWPVSLKDFAEKKGLFLNEVINFKNNNKEKAFRTVSIWKKTYNPELCYSNKEIVIYKDDLSYTEVFSEKLKPFYFYI